MADLELEIDDDPAPDDLSIVERGLAEHGESRSEPRNAKPLTIFLREPGGRVVGGLRGASVWGWLEIKWLWLAESYRGKGFGSQLMVAAEEQAVHRGCRHAWLDTFEFQAPEFYRIFGTLEDFPRGHTRYFMRKMNLNSTRAARR